MAEETPNTQDETPAEAAVPKKTTRARRSTAKTETAAKTQAKPKTTTRRKTTAKKAEPVAEAEVKVEVNEEVVEAVEKPLNTFVEHQRNAFNEASKALDSLIPEGFKEHSKAAAEEAVDGYRTLFNSLVGGVVDTVKKIRPQSETIEDDEVVIEKQ